MKRRNRERDLVYLTMLYAQIHKENEGKSLDKDDPIKRQLRTIIAQIGNLVKSVKMKKNVKTVLSYLEFSGPLPYPFKLTE